RLAPARVSLVPGNHDVYTRGAARSGRFESYLGEYATSDLPNVAAESRDFTYPYVRLCGPAAIIGLSSALPRPPLIASGALGAAQRRALERILSHPALQGRLPVLLQHHPPLPRPSLVDQLLGGLYDGRAERRLLQALPRGLVLHGHLHRRMWSRLPGPQGQVDVLGATSASLVHGRPDRSGGFNQLEIDDEGRLAACHAVAWNREKATFQEVELPAPAPHQGAPDRPRRAPSR
ncbi:MAG: metallophosphoesterase, partial [Deltaproteobacteria bacterium]|nr:metallophosphoesterase [Deltaproteobacteria bacterium]MBW2536063.1 metallophosphoesterase [Deltaproteobacteria bacterium]